MTKQQQIKDELSLQRSRHQRRRRIRLFSIVVLVILALFFSIWTLSLVFYPKKEIPRMSFFRSDWVIESVSCRIARIEKGSVIEAPSSGIFVPFVRDKQSVATGDLIGLIAPESLSSEIEAYRDAREKTDQACYLASEIGYPRKKEMPQSPGDSVMRAAYRELAKAPSSGNLKIYQDTLRGLDEAYNRTVLEYVVSGTQSEAVIALEKTCADIESTLRSSVGPGALIFAHQAGVVQFAFVPDSYDWEDNDWLRYNDPASQIDKIVSNSEVAINSAYRSIRQGSPIGSIDDLGRGQFMVMISEPDQEVLTRKTDDLVALYLIASDTLLQNLQIKKAEKSKENARFIITYSSNQASKARVADNDVEFVHTRAYGWVVPIRSLFNLSDEVYKPIDPNAVRSGEYFGLKMISGGRVYSVCVKVLAADGLFAVIESAEPDDSTLPLPGERSLYVVNPWSIAEGELIG
jgi:hypothetical protein